MDTNIRVRRSLEHIRRRLSGFFIRGLAQVTPEDTAKIQASIEKLEVNEDEKERLNDISKSLDALSRTNEVHIRFKLATKIVLSLDQVTLRRLGSPVLSTGELQSLKGSPHVFTSTGSVPTTSEGAATLAQTGGGIPELIQYIHSRNFAPEKATVESLTHLLSHSGLRHHVLNVIRTASPTVVAPLAEELLSSRNRLLSLSGAELLSRQNSEEAVISLLKFPDRPYMLDFVRQEIRTNPAKYAKALFAITKEEERIPHKRNLVSLLHFVKPQPEDIDYLKELEKSKDRTTASYATIALLTAGSVNEQTLKLNISNLDDDVLRIYSKLFLYRKNIVDSKHLLPEFNSDDSSLHKLLLTALEELGYSEMTEILGPIIQEAIYGTSPSIRKKNLRKLLPTRSTDLAGKVLLQAAWDKDPKIAAMVRKKLVELFGFDALSLFFDLSQAIFTAPENLSLDALHYINYYVLPLIPHTGDCRFTRFLNSLFVKHSEKNQKFDYENNIKPLLIDFGEPLVSALSEDLFATEQEMSLAAEELLVEIGGAQAETARSCFAQGAAPVEMAFRQLLNPRTADSARQVIVNEGPGTVPRLLELLVDPRYREECLSILAQFGDPSSFDAMLKLLGNPSTDLLVSGDISVIMRDTGFSERPITRHLITIGTPVVQPLIEKLHDDNWTVRYHAALILGEIGNSSSVPELIRLLNREEDSLEVVGAVIKSFGLMETTEAVPLLIPFLTDPSRDLRVESYKALGRIGTAQAVEALEQVLANCRQLSEKRDIQRAIDEARRVME